MVIEGFTLTEALVVSKIADSCLSCFNWCAVCLAGGHHRHSGYSGGHTYVPCPVCGRSVRNIKRHMLVHTGERPYSCQVCGRNFTQQANLDKHMTVHTGERKYSCPICQKRYKQSSHVRNHMAVHPQCNVCGNRFREMSVLHHHMKTAHSVQRP